MSNIVKALYPPRFEVDGNQKSEILDYFHKNGYVVIKNVANSGEISDAKSSFWNYCESTILGLDRNDPKTWDEKHWPSDKINGITNFHGFNHSNFMWNSRLLPKVKEAFKLLWATNDLIVSFDAGNAFRPWQYDPEWLTKGGWWHIDQNSTIGPHRAGLICVQGLVTYYDANENTGGLCVIPFSHLQHDEICSRSPYSKLKIDFVQIEESDPITQMDKYLICAKEGDLILWDSRLVHCNTPALTYSTNNKKSSDIINQSHSMNESASSQTIQNENNDEMISSLNEFSNDTVDNSTDINKNIKDNNDDSNNNDSNNNNAKKVIEIIRLVSYVCMLPRRLASVDVLTRRINGFKMHLPTSHWPTQRIEIEHFASRGPDIDLQSCPKEMLRLVGYSEYQIKKIKGESVCIIN
eukprot:gene14112-18933_t